MFITVEGIDGCGKSTQLRLLAAFLEQRGIEAVLTREPGGTKLGERVRQLLLTPTQDPMTQTAELLLYAAARAELVAKVIRPALARDKVVLCDRFSDSTVAYQVWGRGLDAAWVETVLLGATGGLKPDLTLLFDLPPELALKRSARTDRLEQEGVEFFTRVRNG
ncbi:MAG: dTMP kinase, partial [Firmicutes bacterium]|nr:dTMP kinase [Bacillota bacterium]